MGIWDFHFYLCFSVPKKYLACLLLSHDEKGKETVSERRLYNPPIDLQAIVIWIEQFYKYRGQMKCPMKITYSSFAFSLSKFEGVGSLFMYLTRKPYEFPWSESEMRIYRSFVDERSD
jgi:hypothetical protein